MKTVSPTAGVVGQVKSFNKGNDVQEGSVPGDLIVKALKS
jgi:hypothetical protein